MHPSAGIPKPIHVGAVATQPEMGAFDPSILSIDPSKSARVLAMVAAALVVTSIALRFLRIEFGFDTIYKLDLDTEQSVPTYFSVMVLMSSALASLIITRWKRFTADRFAKHWAALTAIFLAMSMDEMVSFHEPVGAKIRAIVGGELGFLYFAWVIPGALFVLAFAAAYWKFLRALESKYRYRLILSACLYVGGAIGMELIGGKIAERSGFETLTYVFVTSFEESLEMSGAIVLLHTLLTYLKDKVGSIKLKLA